MSGSGGLITSLVRALDLETAEQFDANDSLRGSKKPRGLTDDEVVGNVFVMNVAGHDTTANTLGFALMLLSASPETQRWLHEEIITVTPNEPGQDWGYELFSRLKRCQAVILETLRLYAPITGLPKVTYKTAQTLRVGNRLFTIPPDIETFPMLLGAQTDPNHWVDPCIWRPSRWILHDETIGTIDKEELLVPQRGTFFPWAEGPQSCPGKKFSQVEAVAVLAHLFRDHHVRPKMEVGETEGDAIARAKTCVDDVNYQFLLRMNNPELVKLECVADGRKDV
ncbi:cytochrome P450 [Seiridium cupressi]